MNKKSSGRSQNHAPSHKSKKKKQRKKIKNKGLKFLIGILIFSVLALAAGTIVLAVLSKTLPPWDDSSFEQSMSSNIYDKNENLISKEFSTENRTPITFDQMPDFFIDALIATEDASFYEHKGFSIKGILRSAVSNIFSKSTGQGGSTLTQQLARGVLLTNEEATTKSYTRKMKEVLLAMQIEDRLTKEEILTHYANTVYFGHNAYGIEAAALTYFNKHAIDLTPAEAALIAGLPQSPSRYDPYENLELAKSRRNDVITRLVETEKITPEEGEALKAEEIVLNNGMMDKGPSPTLQNYKYFTDAVTLQAEQILTEKNLESLYKGGYNIYTTLDPLVQQNMEAAYNEGGSFPEGMNGVEPESAMIVIDHTNGEIRGLVGGRTYLVEKGFNRALDGKRQPGSTFKPLAVYGPAFEKGVIAPSSIYNDSPTPPVFNGQGAEYPLVNYSGSYSGEMTIRRAVKDSTNTIAVRVLNDISPGAGFDFARRIGITSLSDNERDNLSLALGGLQDGVTPLEMARAFGVFANNGVLVDNTIIRRITDSYGNVIYENKPEGQQVISPEVAYMVTSVLEDVVKSGTGTGADIYGTEVAGKTGSTDLVDPSGNVLTHGNKDLWFVGYTPELTGAVWMGYDNTDADHYLPRWVSSNTCSVLWSNVISNIPITQRSFNVPANIETLSYDPYTGLPTSQNTGLTDIFIKGLHPGKPSNSLIDRTPTEGSAKMENGTIVLSWKGPEGVYTITRTDSTMTEVTIGETNTTTFTDSNPGTNFPLTYKIKSQNKELVITYEKI